jgi:hypothetical protein
MHSILESHQSTQNPRQLLIAMECEGMHGCNALLKRTFQSKSMKKRCLFTSSAPFARVPSRLAGSGASNFLIRSYRPEHDMALSFYTSIVLPQSQTLSQRRGLQQSLAQGWTLETAGSTVKDDYSEGFPKYSEYFQGK